MQFESTTLSFLGGNSGIVTGLMVTGILCKQSSWDTVFYVEGAIGVIWFTFYAFLCYNTPREHPRISQVNTLSTMK